MSSSRRAESEEIYGATEPRGCRSDHQISCAGQKKKTRAIGPQTQRRGGRRATAWSFARVARLGAKPAQHLTREGVDKREVWAAQGGARAVDSRPRTPPTPEPPTTRPPLAPVTSACGVLAACYISGRTGVSEPRGLSSYGHRSTRRACLCDTHTLHRDSQPRRAQASGPQTLLHSALNTSMLASERSVALMFKAMPTSADLTASLVPALHLHLDLRVVRNPAEQDELVRVTVVGRLVVEVDRDVSRLGRQLGRSEIVVRDFLAHALVQDHLIAHALFMTRNLNSVRFSLKSLKVLMSSSFTLMPVDCRDRRSTARARAMKWVPQSRRPKTREQEDLAGHTPAPPAREPQGGRRSDVGGVAGTRTVATISRRMSRSLCLAV